ncbi:nuclear transport factor 2 family protein [Nonomuraea angiospora]|uniref:SnoaL-like aldol condensation-catalyzing enzyme n=1 Tax=Nonomuraea angiospora TaxID=46172 RepID=A0ABR9M4A8_9ACTN|nr:nuclear transport factor 2 family protein [Nonomuraea angiospora]MBE1587171.1 putative SnoaL-like aldol condensation-catalyzing enzyme [Nonomuraea angiospora]
MSENGTAGRNKEIVLRGFSEFAAGNVEILRELLREDFVEHSPGNPSGRDAFVEFIASAPVAGAKLDLKRVIAEDDHVMLHYHMVPPGDGRGIAVVDIWRMVDGRIVEHWDVVQPVPDPDELPNGMF